MRNNYDYQIVAIGDVFLQTKSGEHNPFTLEIEEFLKKQRHVLVNLETVLADDGVPHQKAINLKNDRHMSLYMKEVGITLANVSNNHALDFGAQGLASTVDAINNAGIDIIGLTINGEQKACILNIDNSIQVGALAYTVGKKDVGNIGIAQLNEKQIIRDIKSLKLNNVDKIMVSLHWGEEYVLYPSPEQQRLARSLIDNGVDVIIGHHPHVLQGIEEYKNGIIFYSLGNFNFGGVGYLSNNRPNSKWGMIVLLNFTKNTNLKYSIIPIKIDNDYRPSFARKNDKDIILNHIREISAPLIPKIHTLFWFREASVTHFSNHLPSYFKRIKRHGYRHLLLMIRWLLKPKTILYYIGLCLLAIKKAANFILLKTNKGNSKLKL